MRKLVDYEFTWIFNDVINFIWISLELGMKTFGMGMKTFGMGVNQIFEYRMCVRYSLNESYILVIGYFNKMRKTVDQELTCNEYNHQIH